VKGRGRPGTVGVLPALPRVVTGLPATPKIEAQRQNNRGGRDISAFTRVFDALCPAFGRLTACIPRPPPSPPAATAGRVVLRDQPDRRPEIIQGFGKTQRLAHRNRRAGPVFRGKLLPVRQLDYDASWHDKDSESLPNRSASGASCRPESCVCAARAIMAIAHPKLRWPGHCGVAVASMRCGPWLFSVLPSCRPRLRDAKKAARSGGDAGHFLALIVCFFSCLFHIPKCQERPPPVPADRSSGLAATPATMTPT
jgi:hypothetical protein